MLAPRAAVLSILSFDLLGIVRSIWNIIFGVIMILLQLNWKQFITRNFGFLHHWFLRGCFFIFVGTNAMRTDEKTNEGEVIFSLFAGFSCIFVGVVELLFLEGDALGLRAAAERDAALASQAALFIKGDVQWRFFNAPERGSVTGNFAMLPGASRADSLEMMREMQRAMMVISFTS